MKKQGDYNGNSYITYTGLNGKKETYDQNGNKYTTYTGLNGEKVTYDQNGNKYVTYTGLNGTDYTYPGLFNTGDKSQSQNPSSGNKLSGYYGGSSFSALMMKEYGSAKKWLYSLYLAIGIYTCMAFSMDFGFGILAAGASGLVIWWTNNADIRISFSDFFVFGISWLCFLFFSVMSQTLRKPESMRVILFILLAVIGLLMIVLLVDCHRGNKKR